MEESTMSKVLMLLENNPYEQDVRVKQEADTLVAAGYHVTVVAPRLAGDKLRKSVDGVEVYQFPAPTCAEGLLGYLWEYGWSAVVMSILSLVVLIREGFDVIHVHNPPDIIIPAIAWYKLLGKRIIYDHHDLAPEVYTARYVDCYRPLLCRLLILFEQLSYRFANHVIVTNQSYKTIAMSRGHVAEGDITVVRNGPSLAFLQPDDPPQTRYYNGHTRITYVGRMASQDGVEHLLKALYYVVYEMGRMDCQCLLVGTGSAVPQLCSQIEELGLGDHVRFTGWVGQDEVIKYLREAHICVSPEPSNAYTDHSTTIKMMEYMAAGKPIVAFDLPEHRFSAGSAAIYACPNDEHDFACKIVELMDAPELCREMGRWGRDRVINELGWTHQAQQLLSAYGKLGSGHGAKSESRVTGSDTG